MSIVRTLALLPFLVGCVQLVAFDQAIVGAPDEVEDRNRDPGGQLCDPDAEVGTSALCTESCEIDAANAETSCGARVRVDGASATIDVSGLHEVEVSVTVCAREGDHFRIRGRNGASIGLRGRSLHVRAAEEAEARPYEDETFFGEDDVCEQRTLVVQTGRMGLEDSGRRLCSAHLVPVDGEWALRYSRTSVRAIEICFRAPRAG